MSKKAKIILAGIIFLLISAVIIFQLTINGIIWPNTPSSKKYPVRGVDVSNYQGDIQWDILTQQDVGFAFIKATEGSSFVDMSFEKNWAYAIDSGVLTGAYHFFSYDSSGAAQAENFINIVPKIKGTLPPVIDVEFYGDKEANLPPYDQVYAELSSMLDILEEYYGVKPIIYTTQKAYNLYISEEFNAYPLWIRNILFKPSQEWTFWQYSNRGRLDGYNGDERFIDLNVFKYSYDELVKMCIE